MESQWYLDLEHLSLYTGVGVALCLFCFSFLLFLCVSVLSRIIVCYNTVVVVI